MKILSQAGRFSPLPISLVTRVRRRGVYLYIIRIPFDRMLVAQAQMEGVNTYSLMTLT